MLVHPLGFHEILDIFKVKKRQIQLYCIILIIMLCFLVV